MEKSKRKNKSITIILSILYFCTILTLSYFSFYYIQEIKNTLIRLIKRLLIKKISRTRYAFGQKIKPKIAVITQRLFCVFFPPIRRKITTKTQGRSPDLQRPCTLLQSPKTAFIAYRPPSSHFWQ